MSGEVHSPESTVPSPEVDTAAVEQKRAELVRGVRDIGRTAADLEQLALFQEPEFEEALLGTDEEIQKKYTGENARQIQWRRDACLYMLARECPARDIARVLHMNLRVIAALAARNGRKLAGFTEEFARELMSSAGSDFALADTKKHEASYLQLVTGGGIKFDKSMMLKVAGGAGQSEPDVIDVEAENVPLKTAREFLERKRLKDATPQSSTPSIGEEQSTSPLPSPPQPAEREK